MKEILTFREFFKFLFKNKYVALLNDFPGVKTNSKGN